MEKLNTNNTKKGADDSTIEQELSGLRDSFKNVLHKIDGALIDKFYCEDRITEMQESLDSKIEGLRTDNAKRDVDGRVFELEITEIRDGLDYMRCELSNISKILEGCYDIYDEELNFLERMKEIFFNKMNK